MEWAHLKKILIIALFIFPSLLFPLKSMAIDNNILYSLNVIPKYIPSTSIPKNNEYKLLFNLPDKGVMQGLTFHNEYFYCSFDLGNGNGKIVKYDCVGNKISETKSMIIGHCAEIAYRVSTNKIYVCNGGGNNPTHVYVVDYNSSKIQTDLNYESLGHSALLAIDNVHDYLILHTALSNDTGNPKFTIINLTNMSTVATFGIVNQGIPQGLETDGKHIYLYTNNKITVIDYNGIIIMSYVINKKGESEGLTIASEYGTSFLAMGYNSPNRIYALKSNKNQKFHGGYK